MGLFSFLFGESRRPRQASTCPHCGAGIGGELEACPRCGRVLTGDLQRDYLANDRPDLADLDGMDPHDIKEFQDIVDDFEDGR